MVDALIILFISMAMLLLSLSAIADDELPSPELLEFLGEWDTKEGEWFNPLWILKNLSSEKDTQDEVSGDE